MLELMPNVYDNLHVAGDCHTYLAQCHTYLAVVVVTNCWPSVRTIWLLS